jgi:FAD/FMN-containing dehydrogenase
MKTLLCRAGGSKSCSSLPIICKKSMACRSLVFGHAGDGNIHTNVMVDFKQPGAKRRSQAALDELFQSGAADGVARSPANMGSAWPSSRGGQKPFPKRRAKCTR